MTDVSTGQPSLHSEFQASKGYTVNPGERKRQRDNGRGEETEERGEGEKKREGGGGRETCVEVFLRLNHKGKIT